MIIFLLYSVYCLLHCTVFTHIIGIIFTWILTFSFFLHLLSIIKLCTYVVSLSLITILFEPSLKCLIHFLVSHTLIFVSTKQCMELFVLLLISYSIIFSSVLTPLFYLFQLAFLQSKPFFVISISVNTKIWWTLFSKNPKWLFFISYTPQTHLQWSFVYPHPKNQTNSIRNIIIRNCSIYFQHSMQMLINLLL